MQDSIEREITIEATKERIYQAIADPEQVVRWFPETLEGEYLVGARPVFGFGEHGKSQVYIEAAQPCDYFAYRWVPGASNFSGDVLAVPNTLVEFRISENPDGSCKVRLTETGFAALSAEVAESSLQQNSRGWDFMLGRLAEYFTGG